MMVKSKKWKVVIKCKFMKIINKNKEIYQNNKINKKKCKHKMKLRVKSNDKGKNNGKR